MSESSKRIINNFFHFLGGDLLAKFLGFLSIVFLARGLGAGDFGRLGFAEAFYGYFIYIGVAGIDTIAMRDVARKRGVDVASAYLGNVLPLKLIVSAAAYALLAVLAMSINIEVSLRRLTLLYGLCLLPIALSPEWLFQGMEKMKYIGLFRILREAVYIAGIFIAISHYPGKILLVPIVRLIAMLLAVLYLFRLLGGWGFRLRPKFDFCLWRSLLKQSYPILASQLLIIVIYNLSIIVLGLRGMPEEAGYLSAAQKIVLFFIGLSGVFWAVVFPRLSRLYVESPDGLRLFEEKISRVICAAAVPIGVVGFALAGQAITSIYGEGYQRSIDIFRILVWVAMLAFISGIFAQGLLATGGQKLFLKTVMLQTAVNVVLVFSLVPKLGGVGAAIAWLTAEGIGFFVYKRFYNRAVSFRFYGYLAKPLVASVAAVLSVGYLNWPNVVLAAFAGGMIYLSVMLLIRGIAVGELRLVYQGLWRI